MRRTLAVHAMGIIVFVMVSLLAMSVSMGCTFRATDERRLNRESDIIDGPSSLAP